MPDCSLGSSMCKFFVSEVVLLVNWICTATICGSGLKGCLLKQYSTARPSPVIRCNNSYILTELDGAIVWKHTEKEPGLSNLPKVWSRGNIFYIKIRNWNARLTVGASTVSVSDRPSRSATRLLDRKLLTGVTWGEGVGSTAKIKLLLLLVEDILFLLYYNCS